ncbi:hypothetical protein [Streptomyces sp. Ag109_G2-15]|nr:hypothetical protein [Streptomyces sp. Ag109_G2-15]SOE06857.1 hypothetical protein SAMN06272765_7725 [Streptomyces sp. Ag109_G2-15]
MFPRTRLPAGRFRRALAAAAAAVVVLTAAGVATPARATTQAEVVKDLP